MFHFSQTIPAYNYIIVDNPTIAVEMIITDLETIHRLAGKWLVKFNPSKSESILVSLKYNRNMHPAVIMNAVYINKFNIINTWMLFYQTMALGMNILILSLLKHA